MLPAAAGMPASAAAATGATVAPRRSDIQAWELKDASALMERAPAGGRLEPHPATLKPSKRRSLRRASKRARR